MDFLEPIGRPEGAEQQDAAFTTALHVSKHSRTQRVNDYWYNPAHFTDIADATNTPLDVVLESNVEAPGAGDLPNMLFECMDKKGIYIKGGYSGFSTPVKKIYDDKGSMILVNGYFDKKTYKGIFGKLEAIRQARAARMQAASTRDEQPEGNTALRPALQKRLMADKNVADFSFSLEDVYADVIPTEEDQIDELIFKSNKGGQEMYLRAELGDIKTVDVQTSKQPSEMKEVALAVRYSEKFARNTVRLSAIDMWLDFVIIRGRNAIRDEGIRKGADGLEQIDLTALGYSLKTLRKLDFHFMDLYPETLLVMSEDTFLNFDQPLGVTNAGATSENMDTRTIVPQGQYNLLNNLSMNTALGVVKEDKVLHDSDTGLVLQMAPDFLMDLHVYKNTFAVRTNYDPDNKSFKTDVCIEYVPVFKYRDARALHDLAA